MTDRRKPMSAEEVKYARAYLEEWGCLAEPLVVRLLDQAADEVEASAAPLLGAMPPSDRRVLEICDNMASKLDAICRTEANDNTTCLARLATNNLDELRAVLADRATRSDPLAEPSAPIVTLNGYELRDALELLAPDGTDEQLEQEVCIQYGPERMHDEGKDEAGLYCWLSEYPEEGSIRLSDEPTPDTEPDRTATPLAVGGVPPTDDKLYDEILEALKTYRCAYTIQDDDNGGLPLADVLTPEGETDVGKGQAEIELIADAVWDAIEPLLAATPLQAPQADKGPTASKLVSLWFDEWELILPPDARESFRSDLMPSVAAAMKAHP